MMYKYIIVESDCQFDLGYYPFDHQNCQMSLAYQGNQGEIIKLIPENLALYCRACYIYHFNFTCSLMNMLVRARNSVTTRLILPGVAESGITKLVCDTRTMIADGR